MWDSLWINGRLATMREGAVAYGAVEPGALAVEGGRIEASCPLFGCRAVRCLRCGRDQNQRIIHSLHCFTDNEFGDESRIFAASSRGCLSDAGFLLKACCVRSGAYSAYTRARDRISCDLLVTGRRGSWSHVPQDNHIVHCYPRA